MSDDVLIGTLFGARWLIERPLMSGGMGSVYVAVHNDTGRRVALKVIKGELVADPDLGARFRRETAALASLSHPNVVTFLDSGIENGNAYLVMELLAGRSLRDAMADGISAARATRIAADVCRALAAVHRAGLVHRDLKPENVFLQTADGHDEVVKLIDFGIVRFDAHVTSTQTGTVVGTPGYISPEQLRGKPATASSDLYAVGVMLYEMTTGKSPFAAPDVHAMLVRQLIDPVVPPSSIAAVPPATEAAILRLMSREALERPATALDVVKLLAPDTALFAGQVDGMLAPREERATPLVTTPALASKPSRTLAVAAAAAVVIVAVAVAVAVTVWLRTGAGGPQMARATPSGMAPSNAAPSSALSSSAALSNAAPSNAAPSNVAPSNASSSNAAPSSPSSSSATASNAPPSSAAPSNASSSSAAPSSPSSSSATAANAPPSSAAPSSAAPSSAEPSSATPSSASSSSAAPSSAGPRSAASKRGASAKPVPPSAAPSSVTPASSVASSSPAPGAVVATSDVSPGHGRSPAEQLHDQLQRKLAGSSTSDDGTVLTMRGGLMRAEGTARGTFTVTRKRIYFSGEANETFEISDMIAAERASSIDGGDRVRLVFGRRANGRLFQSSSRTLVVEDTPRFLREVDRLIDAH